MTALAQIWLAIARAPCVGGFRIASKSEAPARRNANADIGFIDVSGETPQFLSHGIFSAHPNIAPAAMATTTPPALQAKPRNTATYRRLGCSIILVSVFESASSASALGFYRANMAKAGEM